VDAREELKLLYKSEFCYLNGNYAFAFIPHFYV